MKEAIFMLGLPASGKSFWIEDFLQHNDYFIVSADDIRVNHPNYNPLRPEDIHELCVSIAETSMYEIGLSGQNIIMDGGGINNSYTLRIINKMKEYGYTIKVVYIDTPAQVCIDRNKQRINNGERFVPDSSIIDKAYRLKKSVEKLQSICDDFLTVPYFTNEHVFVDIDGTLAEYQNLPIDNDGDINFVGYEVFKYSSPVKEMIGRVKMLQTAMNKKVYIISASPNSISNNEKLEWLNKHVDFIKQDQVYFVGNKNFKHTFLKHLMLKLNLKPNQCMVIDDDHRVLDLYRTIGVNPVHPSSFQSTPLVNY
jgi:predicted kinase